MLKKGKEEVGVFMITKKLAKRGGPFRDNEGIHGKSSRMTSLLAKSRSGACDSLSRSGFPTLRETSRDR